MKISIVFLFVLLCTPLVYAQQMQRDAYINELEGDVKVKFKEEAKWKSAEEGMHLKKGDIIKTGRDAYCVLYLDGKQKSSEVEIKEGSQMRIAELSLDTENGSTETLLDLAIGKVLIEAQKLRKEGSIFEIKTPTSIVGVRGTVFEVEVEALN